MSIHNYRHRHILVKYGRPIRKSNHLRPTYLSISINDQVDGRGSENRDRSALISNHKYFALDDFHQLYNSISFYIEWQWCCLHATQHRKVTINSELILVSFLMCLFHNSCLNFYAPMEYNCKSIILLCFPPNLVVATAHWHWPATTARFHLSRMLLESFLLCPNQGAAPDITRRIAVNVSSKRRIQNHWNQLK